MGTISQDIRFALRQFMKRPGFTLTAMLILALGLGANTAIFSVVNAFLIRPLPYKDPARLVAVYERDVIGTEPYNSVSAGALFDWQRYAHSFESIGGYFSGPMNLTVPGSEGAQRVNGCACSANIFPMLGVSTLLGRPFSADEDVYAPRRFTLISYNLWQSRFGGTADILKKHIQVDGEDTQIIGVMPEGFAFPARDIDVWQPLMTYMAPAKQIRHDSHYLLAVGRLKPGVTADQARAEIDAITARYYRAHAGEPVAKGANAVPLHRGLLVDAAYLSGGEIRGPLLILLGAVFVVLMIACVNVANLLLTRAAGRSRELAVRAAIGATRSQIIRQLLTESILLSIAGAVLGMLAATSLTNILAAHAPGAKYILSSEDLPVDKMVYLFTFGIALITGVAAGLFPALQSSRTDLVHGLRDSSWSSTASRSQGRFRGVLVAAEVALSLMLLVSAGLLIRSFAELYRVNPGVRVDHTLMMGTYFPNAGFKDPSLRAAFERQLAERLQSLPGVIDAGLVTCPPLGGHCNDHVFTIEGRAVIAGQLLDAIARGTDAGYFKAAGIPLLRGRVFTDRDGTGFDAAHPQTGALVISESFQKQFFPDEDPIGRHLHIRDRRYEIVGIVGDVLTGLDRKPEPTMYNPIFDGEADEMFAVLHTSPDPRGLIAAARNEIHRLNPEMAVYDIQTMEDTLGVSAADRRFSMLLFSAFAGLAVFLAAVGVYGVLSFAVAQRKGEIGIRMALGASASDVSRLILTQGMKPAFAGIFVGLIGASIAAQVLRSLLFGVAPSDPVTFTIVPLLLAAVAALASYVPAWRAARIDPTVTLRAE